MSDSDWKSKFKAVYDRGSAAWLAGRRSPAAMFSPDDAAFLESIGCTTQELFDFIDDHHRYGGDPDYATTLAVTELRRDYFLNVMGGKRTGRVASMNELPAKSAAVDGIEWLPRLIAKARLKLRGEMPPDLMYGCGGDRPFVREMRTTLEDFLKLVRDCGGDDRRIVDAVKKRAGIA